MTTQALKNISLRISSGGTPSRKRPEYFSVDSGHLWVKSKELLDSGISNTEEKITDEALNNSSAKYFPEHSVLIAMYGANVGQLGWLKNPATVNQAVCGLVIDPEKADWRYIFYALLQNRNDLTIQARGAAQQNLNQDLIKDFELSLLPIENQHSVADVLSTYDDLIENNTRRIKILEQIAQATYTEWFVNFRFPGHEKVKMTDSGTDFGKIPEEWEVKSIKDFGGVITGKTPSKSDSANFGTDVPFIKTPDLHGKVFCIETKESLSIKGANTQKNKTLPPKTLVVSCIGTMGVVGITSSEAQTNQQINSVVLSDQRYLEYFYFVLANLKQELKNLGSNGATMGNVNKDKFENIKVLSPSQKVIFEYHSTVSLNFDEILNLQKQNKNLRQSRDLILPKLVTGEIEVK